MKRNYIAAIIAAGLLLSPVGLSRKDYVEAPKNTVARVYGLPSSAAHAGEINFKVPFLDFEKTINSKPVQFYNFDLNSIELKVLLEKKPQMAGYYIEHLLNEYGDNLEFIADAGWYCMKRGDSVGRVVVDGDIKARGSFDGGIYLRYKDGKVEMSPNFGLEQINDFDWVHGGFARLVLNHKLDSYESKTRRNISYWEQKPRIAFIIYNDSNAGFAFYTGNLNNFAHGLKALGIEDACLFDEGNSRFFAFRNHDQNRFKILKRDNPKRAIKSVVYGVRK